MEILKILLNYQKMFKKEIFNKAKIFKKEKKV
jgi:hypothetical protein